jgi:hypothetical protein
MGDRESASALEQTKRLITANYQANVAAAIQEATRTLSSLIQQATDSIMLQVQETYATEDDIQSQIGTQLTQLSASFTFPFTQLETTVTELNGSTQTKFTELEQYIRFEDGNIILGEKDNSITLRIENDRIVFLDGGAEVAYFTNKQLVVTDAHFLNSLRIGSFAWVPRSNGNLSLIKVG